MARKFDTKVQLLKYNVLREVAASAWRDSIREDLLDLPRKIVPGPKPTMRCCIYKERAILVERIKMAMGAAGENVIRVLDIACDECPVSGYEVTNACRGCLMNRCEDVCRKGAISFDSQHVAQIDKDKCVECGLCARACPYTAIVHRTRPCESACKVKAISVSTAEDKSAHIDDSKCTSCGACVYACPFGAITDVSQIVKVVRMLRHGWDVGRKVYAVVAPAISSQFTYARLGQVVTGLKELGFTEVVEAALGADMVARNESEELVERGFLLSSCCPAFVSFVEKTYPQFRENISSSLSPMATIAKFLKEREKDCRVVFIGPCTAKKQEIQKPEVAPWVDAVLTFEELQALFDSKDIDITSRPESPLEGASYFGRIFARCGGLAEAVAEGIRENGHTDFVLKPISCDGIEECRIALLKKAKGMIDVNFIEGMACVGGCIGGAGCLTHGERNKLAVDKYGQQATERTILDAVRDADRLL